MQVMNLQVAHDALMECNGALNIATVSPMKILNDFHFLGW
jgi:fumarate hydratase class II